MGKKSKKKNKKVIKNNKVNITKTNVKPSKKQKEGLSLFIDNIKKHLKNFINKFKKMSKNKRNLIVATSFSVLVIILTLAVTSYALFQKQSSSNQKNLFATGDMTITFEEDSSSTINIDPAIPTSDSMARSFRPYKFTIKNNGDYGATYNVRINDDSDTSNETTNEYNTPTPRSAIKYSINDQPSRHLSTIQDDILTSGYLNAGESKTFELRLWIDYNATIEISKSRYLGQISCDGKASITGPNFKNQLVLNNYIQYNPTFSATSTDKGLFVQSGDSNKSVGGQPTYYYRGDVENNYVQFANEIWRIVRINEDGSIRLIAQESLSNSYYISTPTYKGSNVETAINTWYNQNIGNDQEMDKLVTTGTFCNDVSGITSSGSSALTRISNKTPIFTCSSNVITAKAGMITADEAMYAGTLLYAQNPSLYTTSYLSNGTQFWTMTAYTNQAGFGWESSNTLDFFTSALPRVVINLKSDVKLRGGTGTKSDPYIIGQAPNPPKLENGMIPVVYNESTGNWIKANVNSGWYDYTNQKWANAVTVTNTNRVAYQNAAEGVTIPISDINTMWVWIPRYKYKISNNLGSTSTTLTPGQIDVIFETGTNTTGTDIDTTGVGNTKYYTHPAFRNGTKAYKTAAYDQGGWDKELTGIWVGKFELTGTSSSLTIKPDVSSVRSLNVSTFFNNIKNMGSNGNLYGFSGSDVHMMKGTEWGAVAYLSQSKYGKMGNPNYSGKDKGIFINNSSSYYTGRSGGGLGGYTPVNGAYTGQTSTTQYNTYGFYTYDDYLLNYNTNTKGSKVPGKGTGASTTGTIYGIYDMSGGSREFVMANSNGTLGSSGFSSLPAQKYYDKYLANSTTTLSRTNSILGDGTWETNYWYSGASYAIYSSNPWSLRGNAHNNSTSASIFNSTYYTGAAYSYTTSRAVLVE